jgi:hypothetical protein
MAFLPICLVLGLEAFRLERNIIISDVEAVFSETPRNSMAVALCAACNKYDPRIVKWNGMVAA